MGNPVCKILVFAYIIFFFQSVLGADLKIKNDRENENKIFKTFRFQGVTLNQMKIFRERGSRLLLDQKTDKFIFQTKKFQLLINHINNYYTQEGYIYTKVSSSELIKNELVIRIWNRPIKKIILKGPKATRKIIEFLHLQVDGAYNVHELEKRTQLLYESSLFSNIRSINITPFLLEDNGIIIEIQITIKSRVTFNFIANSDFIKGPKTGVDYRQTNFLGSPTNFYVHVNGNIDSENLNRIKVEAGLTNLERLPQKNTFCYEIGGSYEKDSFNNLEILKPYGTLAPMNALGLNTSIFYLFQNDMFYNFSRFIGFHGAPLISFTDLYYLNTVYNNTRVGIKINDEDYISLPYIRSFFRSGFGFYQDDFIANPSVYYFLQMDYKFELFESSFFNLQTAGIFNRESVYYDHLTLEGQNYSYEFNSSVLYSQFFIFGLHFLYDLFDTFFFIGPGIVFRVIKSSEVYNYGYNSKINKEESFFETGISGLYIWEALEIKIKAGRIIPFDSLDSSWGISYNILYRFY